MKKRTAFFGALLSLLPLGQPLLIKTGVTFSTVGVTLFVSEKVNAESANFFINRGVDKLDAEDYKGAISDFTEAIKINPKDGVAYFNRGLAKDYLEDYKGAISDYTEAIKINPKDGDAYYNIGVAKESLEDYKGAISDYTQAIKFNRNYGDAYWNRGLLKQKLKDIKGAVDDMNRALKIYSKNKFKLSIEDILYTDISSDPILRGFNKFAGFDGNTYQRPITYYIHDKNEKLKSKLLPKKIFKKSFEHSVDEEKFIVSLFSQIDKYIDLDFQRVNSKTDAMIRIYKTNFSEDYSGMASDNGDDVPDRFFRIDIAWSESPLDIAKLKKYPTLSVDDAHTIVHEIGHALGLAHFDEGCGKYCKSNFDPDNVRINNKTTVMSYNNFFYPVDDMFFTKLDLEALRQQWGVEKEN